MVNLGILRQNLTALKKLTDAKICSVVKANAYGHGIKAVQAFSESDEFAVSSIGEAEELSEFTDKPINILSVPDKTVMCNYRAGIYPTVATMRDMEFAAQRGASAVNIKINTGMNRYGAPPDRLEELLKESARYRLKVKSVFSHIYDLSAAQMQFEIFWKSVKPFSDYIPQKHILSSNFTVLPKYMHLDMVRPGIVLYGYNNQSVNSAVTAVCGITQVRTVNSSDCIGYGRNMSNIRRRIAVLAAGYADGFRRICCNEPRYVEIGGVLCPIVGQVCMDAAMADVSGINVNAGDEAYIIGGMYGCEALAVSCGTICYEILTGFGSRVKREYLGE